MGRHHAPTKPQYDFLILNTRSHPKLVPKSNINCSCLGEPDNKIISASYAKAPAKQLPTKGQTKWYISRFTIEKWEISRLTINLSNNKLKKLCTKMLPWG